MLKIHLKLMAFVMVSITFYEKIITSDEKESNNSSSSQLIVYQLDLRPSARYAGVLYDANKKETDEEHAYFHTAVNRVLRNRYNNNVTAHQIEQRNLLFIAMPAVLSASSLSVVQEEDSKDSDDSDNSVATDIWSTNVDVSVFDNNIDETSEAVVSLRRSISLNSSSHKSDASLDSKDIHDLNDDDFAIGSSSSVSFTKDVDFTQGNIYPKTPYNSPEDNSLKNEKSHDGDLA